MGINLDTECWVCGKPERYNVCVDCGVDVYMNTEGPTDSDNILKYIQENNPERFNQIIKQYNDESGQ